MWGCPLRPPSALLVDALELERVPTLLTAVLAAVAERANEPPDLPSSSKV